MKPARDTETMTPEGRLSELADILATGYRRLVLNLEKSLAERAQHEAQSDHAVNSAEEG